MTANAASGLIRIASPSSSSARSAWFRLADDGRCFEGHFDGVPILPGVAHLALAMEALSGAAGGGRVLGGLRDVKFSRALRPGDEVEVVLTEAVDGRSMRFEIRSRGDLASAGQLVFQSPDHAAAR